MQGGSAYGVKYQARCIAALGKGQQDTYFLVGTLSLREENEVHLIKYTGSTGDIVCEGLYPHQHEIWDLATCPYDFHIFSTVYASGGEHGAALWMMPEHSKNSSQLQQLAPLDGHACKIKCTLWWHGGKHTQLVSIDEEALYLWNIDASGKSAKVQAQASSGLMHHMANGAWDPHDINNLATASESCVQCWDLRTMKQTLTIDHSQVRDIDFNPKKHHIVLTTGDDSRIVLWDQRMLGTYLVELPGQTHWTTQARFNPVFDDLILSSGTDSIVNLWQVQGLGGSKMGSNSPMDSPRGPLDPLVRSYNGHEDSIYGLAWSEYEPWIFASLSYDGRVLVESVPQAVSAKMKQAGGVY